MLNHCTTQVHLTRIGSRKKRTSFILKQMGYIQNQLIFLAQMSDDTLYIHPLMS